MIFIINLEDLTQQKRDDILDALKDAEIDAAKVFPLVTVVEEDRWDDPPIEEYQWDEDDPPVPGELCVAPAGARFDDAAFEQMTSLMLLRKK